MKALNGYLIAQKQLVYNVGKLHRPRILDAFLADTVDTTRL